MRPRLQPMAFRRHSRSKSYRRTCVSFFSIEPLKRCCKGEHAMCPLHKSCHTVWQRHQASLQPGSSWLKGDVLTSARGDVRPLHPSCLALQCTQGHGHASSKVASTDWMESTCRTALFVDGSTGAESVTHYSDTRESPRAVAGCNHVSAKRWCLQPASPSWK